MGRLMVRLRILVPLLLFEGCGIFHTTHKPTYETVQADPHHDIQKAEREHAKALAMMGGSPDSKGCNWGQVQEHLQNALVADVTYGPAHNTLGTCYLRDNKFYLAAWEFDYAAKLMPDRPEPLYNLALVYESVERLDRATEYYKLAAAVAPRNPLILEGLVRARLRNGDKIADVREQLKDILLYETRPLWTAWAKNQLGVNPLKESPAEAPAKSTPAEPKPEPTPPKPRETPPKPPVPDKTLPQSPQIGPMLDLGSSPALPQRANWQEQVPSGFDVGPSTLLQNPPLLVPIAPRDIERSGWSENADVSKLPGNPQIDPGRAVIPEPMPCRPAEACPN